MSKVLEIFGKGLTVNTAEVVGHWLSQKMSQEEPSDHTECLIKMNTCLANRELEQAEKIIQRYLTQFPECILGRMAAVNLCLLQDDLEEAIQQAQSVYVRQPANTMALYVIGYCYERLGEIEQALEFYQDCVKFKSFLQLPRQRMAAIYLKEGQLEKAAKEYEILTSEHPDDISSIILLGHLYLEANKLEQAVDTFNLGILSHPDNFNDTGGDEETQALVGSGMFEEALETVKYAVEHLGLSQDLLVKMGDIYSQWEKESQAIACYENAILLEPNSLEARIKLGTHYLRNRRFSLAAEEFNKASDINDEIVDAYMGLAIAQKGLGLDEDSSETLGLASSIQKNSVLLQTEASTLLLQSTLNEKNSSLEWSDKEAVTIEHVIKACQERIKNSKTHADVHNQYGILLLNEGDIMGAISAFENSLALNPLNYRVLYKLSLGCFDNKQTGKSLRILMGMGSCGAGSFEKYYQMTILFADKKMFASAMKKTETSTATRLYESVSLQDDLKQILISLGSIDRSYATWEQINKTSEYLIELAGKKSSCGHN